MSVEYLLTSLVVILLPGTGVLYTMAAGLSRGLRASLFAAFGCTLGILPHIAASIAGLAALLYASTLAFQVVKYVGVAYLFYMAWSIWRAGGVIQFEETTAPASPMRVIVLGFLTNILNPKLSLFFLAFLPQFIPADATNIPVQMMGLAAIFMGLTFIVFVGYGAFASLARRHVISRPSVMKWFQRGVAGAFGALGLRLAFAER
ncbi:MAG: LysE family translocator [Pseudomonadota bacterium]